MSKPDYSAISVSAAEAFTKTVGDLVTQKLVENGAVAGLSSEITYTGERFSGSQAIGGLPKTGPEFTV